MRRFVLTITCPDGDRGRGERIHRLARRMGHRGRPARRPHDRAVLPADRGAGREPPLRARGVRTSVRGPGERVPAGLAHERHRRPQASGRAGRPGGPLSCRPLVSLAQRRSPVRDPRSDLQSPRSAPAGRVARHRVPPPARHSRTEGRGARRRGLALRGCQRRRDGPGALHAGHPGRSVRPLSRKDHQHPPQLPALLRWRPPLPQGIRARSESDRCHLSLRDIRARRRTDHRAGHQPDRPRQHGQDLLHMGRASSGRCSPGGCAGTWRTGCS